VVEFPDRILFQNAGSFIPASVEQVITSDAPSTCYRNPFLARAMVNLNMIDTIGSGIKRMFIKQRERYFPLPEYELDRDSVSVTVMGRILDPRYVQHLSQEIQFSLSEVMLLDKVQKGSKVSKEGANLLRGRNLVEGRYPRLHISAQFANLSDQKAKYLHTRGLDEQHYADLILEHIRTFGSITRKEADDLLSPKLPDLLNEKQKKYKVNRLLSVVLRGQISNRGSKAKSRYFLKTENKEN
jgi:ATP-dependent DNA helicase RecG